MHRTSNRFPEGVARPRDDRPIAIRVGTNMGVFYCQTRNLLLPYSQFVVQREWDPMALADRIWSLLTGRPHPKWHWLFHDLGRRGSQMFHFYNCVSRTTKPWVVTAETALTELRSPSFEPIQFALGEACKAILHLSRWGYERQLRDLEPRIAARLVNKMRVCHPPQRLLARELTERDYQRSDVRFILVGHSFYRKGGYETVVALDRLRREGYGFHLDIVGRMFYGEANNSAFGVQRQERLHAIVGANPRHFTLHGILSNEQTLALLRDCDVGLLPSLVERYGFAVLEFMASGLPVVTTNQRAFPEINDPARGWLAQLPTANGVIAWKTSDEKRTTSAHLEEELYRIFRTILDCPSQIRTKSGAALRYIADNHDPGAFVQRMAELYRQALEKR